jgi:YesN/AraC family two-component response regulator
MMPGMDGIETVTHLRNLGYASPIVALTANAVTGQADMFLRNGFDGFISKPIDIRQLNSILNKFVRDKQPHDVIEEARRQQGVETNKNNGNNLPLQDPLLIESFIRDANKALATIEELFQKTGFEKNEEDLRIFTITIHGLKSPLVIVGEKELAELASKLEIAGREHNIGFITASTQEFLDNLHKVLKKIKSERDEDNSDNPDEDIDSLRSKLLSIQEMCKNYNKKGVLNVLSEINNCSKETRKTLENIMGYLLHSEFEEAENTAAAYAARLLTDTSVKFP